jgi:hypothetical protein
MCHGGAAFKLVLRADNRTGGMKIPPGERPVGSESLVSKVQMNTSQ